MDVNKMRKKERDEMLQRISEAKSLDDLINEFNRKDQMLAPQGQEQEQERVQQRPSSWDPQKRNWSYKSGQVKHYQQQQGKQYQQVTLIWLFLIVPLVSAQCSTCLGGKCHETGQCFLGCVPGYMNQYCDDVCPSNCLNNACQVSTTSATITCTDGCKAGYCGTKCTRPCPEGCVTCDRQCGSCNKTLCPERHYGTGCRSVCSRFYEKCDRETGECLRCRRGYYGDKCHLKCPICFPGGRDLMYKCLSGCHLCKEQDACPEGLFGKKCELECSSKCGLSQATAGHPCNRATGECSAGCKPGYYGLTCNYTCNEFCEDRLCNQHDGVCTSGCVSGYTKTSKSCEKLQDTGDKDLHVLYLFLCILIFDVMCGLIRCLVFVIYGRSLIRRSKESSEIGNASRDKTEREPLTGEMI